MQLMKEIHSEILNEILTYSKVSEEVIEVYRHSLDYPKGDILRDCDNQLLAMGVWEQLRRDLLKREVEKLDALYVLYTKRSKREPNKHTRAVWRARAAAVHAQACALWRGFRATYGIA